jgi:hypothetical protein
MMASKWIKVKNIWGLTNNMHNSFRKDIHGDLGPYPRRGLLPNSDMDPMWLSE